MVLNRLLYALRFDANVALGGGGGAVLQKPLDEGDVIAVVLVNLRGIPLAEAVGADALMAQVVANDCQLLLYGPLCDRKQEIYCRNRKRLQLPRLPEN